MTSRQTERAVTWSDWLRMLTPAQREAVRLCWVEGYTMREAGAQLGVSHGAVRNRLGWARKKFGIGAQTPAFSLCEGEGE